VVFISAALALALASGAPVVTVDGAVSDAMLVRADRAPQVWLTSADRSGRHLVRLTHKGTLAAAPLAVPADAIFVDACPDGTVVFADEHGLVGQDGARLVDGRALFTVADPDALYVADLCGKSGAGAGELRVPVVDGIAVKRPAGGTAVVLRTRHDARSYSGRVHRGLRPDRGYAEALSLYGPRLLDVDVDGDGKTDLVAVREGRLTAWRRGDDGALAVDPAVERDLAAALGGGDVDLRVRLLDVDGDKRADAVIGVTRGAVPDKSEAWLVSSSSKDALFTAQKLLWRRDGLVAPIGNRGKTLVVAEIDTSLVSLSAVLLTGRIPVKVGLEGSPVLAMQAKVDVRAGRMDGALPVVSVDFDGDGIADLLDLGEPGKAALHLGTSAGFASDAAVTWEVPPFVHVVAMPDLPGVVLVGSPARGKTAIAILTR
jgi:hypothetical protein